MLLPILIVGVAVVLMRTEPDPEARPRLVLGSLMIGLPVLGLWHVGQALRRTPRNASGLGASSGMSSADRWLMDCRLGSPARY